MLFDRVFLNSQPRSLFLVAGKLSSAVKAGPDRDGVTDLSLVKLTRNGLLLLTFPSHTQPDTVNIVSNIIQALESGNGSLLA